MSRETVLVVSSVIILIILNFAIFQKEIIKNQGDTVFLALAPVDPRSLMQGDYMALRYDIERKITAFPDQFLYGYVVIELEQNKVGSFKRFYQQGESLAENEKLLRYHREHSNMRIVPNAFFFQEGHAQIYQNAKYGEFKFDKSGNHLLIGLADKDLKSIQP
jgi:uncharacterized membrane-anchored protein